jgi:hypothetical protein
MRPSGSIGLVMKLLSLVFAIGCAARVGSPGDNRVITGEWGGLHAGLTLSDSGGSIQYDCAHGTISGRLKLSDGTFSVAGFHFREHPGPVRIGEPTDSVSAVYYGQVRGDQMTLRVIANADTLGPFSIRRGAAATIMRCLYKMLD